MIRIVASSATRTGIIFAGFLLLAFLAGCGDPDKAPPPVTLKVTTDNFCRIMKSIDVSWSVHDTTESITTLRTMAHVKTCTCARVKPKACQSRGIP